MRKLALSVLCCIFLISCASKEEKEIINTVKAYNMALVQAYRDVELKYMKPFASEKETGKLLPIMQALTFSNSRMIAIQDEFSVRSVSAGKDTATLKADEQWTYWWESVMTGEVTREKKTQKYKLVYNLKKVKGKWVVDKLGEG